MESVDDTRNSIPEQEISPSWLRNNASCLFLLGASALAGVALGIASYFSMEKCTRELEEKQSKSL